VCFAADVADDALVAAQVFERPLVLYRDESNEVRCLADQCPHRLAPLSDGRLATDAEGRKVVECSYHGWQFAGCGRCTCLPQLEERKEIKTLYDARGYPCEVAQGVVYAYGGRADLPLMNRGDADSMEMSRGDATPAARIFRDESRRRRGCHMDLSVETGRGAAAAATWIFRGDESRRRRGRDADIPWR